MRLFVALDLSDATRAHVRAVRDELALRVDAAPGAPRVAWVAEQSAHVTLRFIGEVAADVADRVRAALSEPIVLAPYVIEFRGMGAFPNSRRPRAVWIGAAAGHAETERLVQQVNARLNPVVGPGEERAFRAHLTVGRVKEPARFDWDAALVAPGARTSLTTVDHVTLYQSKTTAKGPTYTALCVTPLVAGAAR